MDEHTEMFIKEVRKYKRELKNTITEIKNALAGMNSRLEQGSPTSKVMPDEVKWS